MNPTSLYSEQVGGRSRERNRLKILPSSPNPTQLQPNNVQTRLHQTEKEKRPDEARRGEAISSEAKQGETEREANRRNKHEAKKGHKYKRRRRRRRRRRIPCVEPTFHHLSNIDLLLALVVDRLEWIPSHAIPSNPTQQPHPHRSQRTNSHHQFRKPRGNIQAYQVVHLRSANILFFSFVHDGTVRMGLRLCPIHWSSLLCRRRRGRVTEILPSHTPPSMSCHPLPFPPSIIQPPT
ncbi:hypothetical protein B0J11DRAFT_320454 [Dendryphion nanum]|uniref:Uncharacterized protein n=1 Tax=Dendryphion nanum TaxID=256645 RepID=A0A9P9ILJ2_9PLEO|nr:hypothetical protein B0J11DRAFT_320454 [Dendryphion nanum]